MDWVLDSLSTSNSVRIGRGDSTARIGGIRMNEGDGGQSARFTRGAFVHVGGACLPSRFVSASVSIKDHDDALCGGGDDVVDIHPANLRTGLDVVVDRATGRVRDAQTLAIIGNFRGDFQSEGFNGVETGVATLGFTERDVR